MNNNNDVNSQLLQNANTSMNRGSLKANKTINSFLSYNNLDDPMSLGYKLFFRFDDTHGLLANKQFENSACAYLTRIGEVGRAELCEKFIELLQNISMYKSYLFQTIDGLNPLLAKKPSERFSEDDVITIGTLETLDMMIQTLLSLYRSIVFDETRNVWILPVNLRRFNISIYLFPKNTYMVNDDDEIALGSVPNAKRNYSNEINENINEQNIHEFYYLKSPDIYNHICYDLSQCEFDMFQSGTSFIAPNNATNETAINNICFNFKFVKNSYRFYKLLGDNKYSDLQLSLYASTLRNNNESEKTWLKIGQNVLNKAISPITSRIETTINQYNSIEKIKSRGINILKGAAETIGDKYAKEISSRLQNMFMGNVYGFSADSILTGVNANKASEVFYSLNRNNKKSISDNERKLSDNENVYSKM